MYSILEHVACVEGSENWGGGIYVEYVWVLLTLDMSGSLCGRSVLSLVDFSENGPYLANTSFTMKQPKVWTLRLYAWYVVLYFDLAHVILPRMCPKIFWVIHCIYVSNLVLTQNGSFVEQNRWILSTSNMARWFGGAFVWQSFPKLHLVEQAAGLIIFSCYFERLWVANHNLKPFCTKATIGWYKLDTQRLLASCLHVFVVFMFMQSLGTMKYDMYHVYLVWFWTFFKLPSACFGVFLAPVSHVRAYRNIPVEGFSYFELHFAVFQIRHNALNIVKKLYQSVIQLLRYCALFGNEFRLHLLRVWWVSSVAPRTCRMLVLV